MQIVYTSSLPARGCQLYSSTGFFPSTSRYGFPHQFTSFQSVDGHVPVSADALTCPREDTVATLWDQLKEHQVIHVRGTPTSGKSTLAQLLKAYVARISPRTQVYAFSCQQPEVLQKRGINGSLYYQLLNFHTSRPIDTDDWLYMTNMLLIIDEAQVSYQYGNLWTQFIKRISSDGDNGRRVILFSSYGSPAEIPLVRGPVGSHSIELSADQPSSLHPKSDPIPKGTDRENVRIRFSERYRHPTSQWVKVGPAAP